MEHWMTKIDSMVSKTYVHPLYPKKGQNVTLSILILEPTVQLAVSLVAFAKGGMYTIACTRDDRNYYHAEIEMPEKEDLFWYFSLVSPIKAYYYSKLGLQGSIPSFHDCFRLIADLQMASWVSGSTCYQIFPDRFQKGDASCGAKPGQYSFDGGSVTVHSFDEKPLDFEQGRCLDFFNGDLKGIENAIPYFKAIGVNTLYLNPIGVSKTTHRYDCCDFFHIDEKLGGDEAFANLCRKLHENHMKIIVDISINHTGTAHPWLQKAITDKNCLEASYYYIQKDGSVACWQDVPTLPQLNYNSQDLRDLMYRKADSVMRKFLAEPFAQDGWRLDVANEVGRRGKDQLCQEIWKEVHAAVKTDNPKAYLVGENWSDASFYLQGDQWDATMNYLGCSRPLRSWMGETDRFMCSGWGHNPSPTVPYTGFELAQALESQLASLPPQMWYLQMNLLDSHDTPRLHNNKDIFDWDIYSGCVMLMFLLPGMPSIYYGDEVGLEGPYGSVESSRYPMQWDRKKWDTRFSSLYADLGVMRKRYAKLLAFGSWKIAYIDNETICFARYDEEQALLAILNRAENAKTITISNGILRIKQVGKGQTVKVNDDALTIDLQAKQNCILKCSC
ncbi:glycosidase [Sphaerochaeta pleomorpha str. Grapes]|uniref:Glycosidase n=1 Tax=Sphaerochaeta pleomorpha (strain ATCC BAA-1885 / DSM 22778 / Grapes) TaxID=158190 RepID=G8QV01_SPHPG|nr:glycoside hydrolase family 13 protein [Sphaerochaeta pleomorpha]AEV28177.1 glycosidase [Sphaerochaeta pleomorpha str. Grapes]